MEQHAVDLNRLETFVAVVDAGSFTRAAARLRQPKSRVSRHISKLEQDLGVQLIYRTTRQFQLTEAGRKLFTQCKEHLEGLDSAIKTITQFSGEVSGPLRVTAPDDLSVELLAGIADEFLLHYPKVQLDLLVTNNVVNLVKSSVDVALRVGPLRDSTLILRKVGTIESKIVASPKLLSKYSALPTIDTLKDYPCLSFPLEDSKWRLRSTKQRRTIKMDPYIQCSNHFVLRSLALAGQGIALLPSFLIGEALSSGALVHIEPDWISEPVPLQILLPPQKNMPHRVRLFVDFLAERLARALARSN